MDSSQDNEQRAPEPADRPGEKEAPREQAAAPAAAPQTQGGGPAGSDPKGWKRHRSGIGGAVFGVWIVAVGVLFLLQNLGVIEIGNIWKFWPLLLIGLGISKITGSYHPGGRMGGAFMVVLGGVFLASNLGYVTHGVWNYIWPLALVFWGVMIILGHSWRQRYFGGCDRQQRRFDRHAFRREWHERRHWERAHRGAHWGDPWQTAPSGSATVNPDPNHPETGQPAGQRPGDPNDSRANDDPAESFSTGGFHASTSGAANRLHEYAILGGVRRRIDSQDFQGGDATAVLGGIELDLSSAGTKLEEVVIEANAFMGGINLRVPQNWDITVRGMGILGGYDDSTRQFAPSPGGAKRPHLIITGQAMFGGVQVKN